MKKFTSLLVAVWLLLFGACVAQAHETLPATLPLLTQGAEVTVEQFGAKGDGVTDDTAAINAAIASPAKIIRMAAKTYLVRSNYVSGQNAKTGITLKSNCKLKGCPGTIIKLAATTNGVTFVVTGGPFPTTPYTWTTNGVFNPVVSGVNVSNVTVEDVEIDGNILNQVNWSGDGYSNPSYGSAYETPGVVFRGGANNTVRNCYVHDCQSYTVEFSNSANGIVEHCRCINGGNGSIGINKGTSTSYPLSGCIVRDCYAQTRYCDDIRIETDNCQVLNCEVAGGQVARVGSEPYNWGGIYVAGSYGSRIIGNRVYDTTAFGIDCDSPSGRGGLLVVSENVIHNCGNGGVEVNCNSVVIHSNVVFNCGKTSATAALPNYSDAYNYTPVGICINTGAYLVISDNIFQDTGQGTQTYGIRKLNGAGTFSHCVVTDNLFVSLVSGSISGDDATTNVIANNRVN